MEQWRKELPAVDGFRVGVVCQGNPHNQWDRHRSFPLAALAAVERVRLVSLQKDHGLEQLRALKGRFPIAELAGGFDPPGEGFLDTAAVMRNLDLVVTTDTATAHLAGALGVRTWVALAQICDWRWLRGRDDSPWYPTVRLFRQATLGDCGAVFERVAAAAVREEMAKTDRAAVIRVEVGPGELMDRITILQIKSERLTDLEKRAGVRRELAALLRTREETVVASEEVERPIGLGARSCWSGNHHVGRFRHTPQA